MVDEVDRFTGRHIPATTKTKAACAQYRRGVRRRRARRGGSSEPGSSTASATPARSAPWSSRPPRASGAVAPHDAVCAGSSGRRRGHVLAMDKGAAGGDTPRVRARASRRRSGRSRKIAGTKTLLTLPVSMVRATAAVHALVDALRPPADYTGRVAARVGRDLPWLACAGGAGGLVRARPRRGPAGRRSPPSLTGPRRRPGVADGGSLPAEERPPSAILPCHNRIRPPGSASRAARRGACPRARAGRRSSRRSGGAGLPASAPAGAARGRSPPRRHHSY